MDLSPGFSDWDVAPAREVTPPPPRGKGYSDAPLQQAEGAVSVSHLAKSIASRFFSQSQFGISIFVAFSAVSESSLIWLLGSQ